MTLFVLLVLYVARAKRRRRRQDLLASFACKFLLARFAWRADAVKAYLRGRHRKIYWRRPELQKAPEGAF
jgi:hypothetical protein